MSDIDFFLERFRENADGPAIAWRDDVYTYGWLADDIPARRAALEAEGVGPGSVVVLCSEYAPATT